MTRTTTIALALSLFAATALTVGVTHSAVAAHTLTLERLNR
jgi:hypothetical protein